MTEHSSSKLLSGGGLPLAYPWEARWILWHVGEVETPGKTGTGLPSALSKLSELNCKPGHKAIVRPLWESAKRMLSVSHSGVCRQPAGEIWVSLGEEGQSRHQTHGVHLHTTCGQKGSPPWHQGPALGSFSIQVLVFCLYPEWDPMPFFDTSPFPAMQST